MEKEYSPFTPGIPVPPDFFTGRSNELKIITEAIRKAIHTKSVTCCFVMGERGIGKSSLCNYALLSAERQADAACFYVFLGGVDSIESMVFRVLESIVQETYRKKTTFSKIRDFVGAGNIREIDLFGVKVEFSPSKENLRSAAANFSSVLHGLHQKLGKGLVLVLDDINGLASDPNFANWFKSLVDQAAISRQPIPVAFIFAGIPERRNQLLKNQPSLDRIFQPVPLKRFDEPETIAFVSAAFGRYKLELDDGDLKLIAKYTAGYPVFIHEIGDAIFRADNDGKIDSKDVGQGIQRGIQLIGEKYIEPQVLDEIHSEKYQNILRELVMPFPLLDSFSKKSLTLKLGQAEKKVLHNFLSKMQKLGVIRKVAMASPGTYAFTSMIYSYYFWLRLGLPHLLQGKEPKTTKDS